MANLTDDSRTAAAITAARTFEAGRADSSARDARLERRRARWREYVAVDFAAILAVCGFSVIVAHVAASAGTISLIAYAAVVAVAWFALNALHGSYSSVERRPDASAVSELTAIFHAAGVACWGAYLVFAAVDRVPLAAPVVVWLLAAPLLSATRSVVQTRWSRSAARSQRTIIVGAGEVGRLLARKIQAHPEAGIRLVGFVDAQPRTAEVAPLKELVPVLGDPSSLVELVDSYAIERVIIAFSIDRHDRLLEVIRNLVDMGVNVDLVPRLFEVIGTDTKMAAVEGLPLLNVPTLNLSPAAQLVKRVFDIVVAGLLVLLLLPSFTLIALAIKLDSKGPVFFRQQRIGSNGPFTILKFRSMWIDADEKKALVAHLNMYLSTHGDEKMFKIESDPRVTRVGMFIRRYFLDELPQLFNVLRGNMSLVGPRPLIPEEDQHVQDWQRRRLALKPGMTGLWQVLGSNDIPFDEMVKLDYLYVSGWTIAKDIQLLLQTVTAVFRRRSHY
jgi:exopolysaccharide biosynthesis polyprenyl glycosylphosphotransferase